MNACHDNALHADSAHIPQGFTVAEPVRKRDTRRASQDNRRSVPRPSTIAP